MEGWARAVMMVVRFYVCVCVLHSKVSSDLEQLHGNTRLPANARIHNMELASSKSSIQCGITLLFEESEAVSR